MADPIRVSLLLGQKELADNRELALEGAAGTVSLSVRWSEWVPRRIPMDLEELRVAGKGVALRFHAGVSTPADLLDVLDGPIPTYPIVWQGTAYRMPVTWHPKYLLKLGRVLENQVYPLLQAGDILAASLHMVESLEMHMPAESVAQGLTEAMLLEGWGATRAMLQPAVDRGAEVMLNVAPSILDWTERILPAIHQDWAWTGCNIFVGDPVQGWDAQGFLCLQCPGSVGVYLQRNMLSRWLEREPTFEERRANLLGMWRRAAEKQAEGVPVKLLEIGARDCQDFPDIISAIQAGGEVWEDP